MTTDITELAQMKGQKVEGSYYLAECTDCGKMYPSNKLNGGEPLFCGDYGECYCPHCNADDAAIGDCGDTAATAWNYQQNRIDALVEALEKAQQLATQQGNIACALFDEVTAQRQRIAELEQQNSIANEKVTELSRLVQHNISRAEDAERRAERISKSSSLSHPGLLHATNELVLIFSHALADNRNPVLAYADSYRDMAKQGVESVPIWSVITDIERNIAPLYRHAQPVPVVPKEMTAGIAVKHWEGGRGSIESFVAGYNFCRAAMLAAAPQDTHALNSVQSVVTVPGKWIPVSERIPEEGQHIIIFCDDAFVLFAQHRDGEFFDVVRDGDEFFETTSRCVTHWMPLPAAPQEVKGE